MKNYQYNAIIAFLLVVWGEVVGIEKSRGFFLVIMGGIHMVISTYQKYKQK